MTCARRGGVGNEIAVLPRCLRFAAAAQSSSAAAGVAILQVDTDRRSARSTKSTASFSNTSTTRSRMACSPSRSVAPDSRGVTSRRTGPHSAHGRRCGSSRRRSSVVRGACGSLPAARRQESDRGASSWSPVGTTTGRSGSRSRRARRASRCASARRMARRWRTPARRARAGVAGSAVFVHQHADGPRRDRRNRRRGPRRGARRFRVADARRRAQERHAAPRLCSRRSTGSRPRSSAGPAARSPRPTSGRTASGRSPRASITPTRSGAATPTTTASAPTSIWS